jgi:PhoH-like ATPase
VPTTVQQSQAPASSSTSADASASPPGVRRTFVLDTSVLLADPGAIRRFHEH